MPKINLLENDNIQALLNSLPEVAFAADIDLVDEKDEESAKAQLKAFQASISFYKTVESCLRDTTLKIDNFEMLQTYFHSLEATIKSIAEGESLKEEDPALITLLETIKREKALYFNVYHFYAGEEKIKEEKDLIQSLTTRQAKAEGSNNKALGAVLQGAVDALTTKNINELLTAKKANPTYTKPTRNGLFSSNAQDLALIEQAENLILTIQFSTLQALNRLNPPDLQNMYTIGTSIDTALEGSEASKNQITAFLASLSRPQLTHLTKNMMLAIQAKVKSDLLRSNGLFIRELYRQCAKEYGLEHKLERGIDLPEEINMLHSVMIEGILNVERDPNQDAESILRDLEVQILFVLRPVMSLEEAAKLLAEKNKAMTDAFARGEQLKAKTPKAACLAPKEKALLRAGLRLEEILANVKKVEEKAEAADLAAQPEPVKAVVLPPAPPRNANGGPDYAPAAAEAAAAADPIPQKVALPLIPPQNGHSPRFSFAEAHPAAPLHGNAAAATPAPAAEPKPLPSGTKAKADIFEQLARQGTANNSPSAVPGKGKGKVGVNESIKNRGLSINLQALNPQASISGIGRNPK